MPQEFINTKEPVFTKKNISFFKMEENAKIPSYAHQGDAGMDIYAFQDETILVHEIKKISTKVKIKLPEGTVGFVCPRSGTATKFGITVINSPGTVDCGYEGELIVFLINSGKENYEIKAGDRIAQLVVVPFISCDVIEKTEWSNDSERGEKGFGSSGK